MQEPMQTWSTFPRADFLNGFYVIRAVGAGRHRRQFGKVDVQRLVVNGVRVGRKGSIILLAALSLQEFPGYLVGREDRGGGAKLRAHVGDGGAHREPSGF